MPDWNPTWTPASDEEIDAQFIQAEATAQAQKEKGLIIVSARYDRKADRIVIDLKNGTTFMFPPNIAQGLGDASPEALADIEISPAGWTVNWKRLNTGFTVEGLLAGIFGGEAWMARLRSENARLGGRATSEAKRTAARENGKKGGRPKKAAP